MAGRIKRMIDKIVSAKSKGNSTIAIATKTKLILKGINIDSYNDNSDDDPVVIEKLKQVAVDFGLTK